MLEFVCNKSDLVHGIATVERAVSKREQVPATAGILIQAQDNKLRFVATNLEMSIECHVPAQVNRPGEVLLEGKVISQIVRKLAGDEVSYTLRDNKTVRIQSGRSTFTVNTMDADEFPVLPEIEESMVCQIPQSDFHRMIRHTIFAAAADDSRPFLTGVLIEVDNDSVTCVATDSSRLSCFKVNIEESAGSQMTGIVPVSSLTELMRILDADEESALEFAVTSSQAVFSLPGMRMISRVIEGQFPDYRRVFPDEIPSKFTISRQEFLGAVERVSLIAQRNAPIVRMKLEEGTLSLASAEAEVGEAFEELAVTQEGNDHETAYQARYLLDVLRAMDDDEVEMGLGDGLKQGSIRSVKGDEFAYIVMPVRVG